MVAIASIRPGPRLGGLQVGHPHPLDAVDGGELGQQGLEQTQVAEVLAVGRGVLRDQEQLADTLAGQPPRLGEHVGGSAAHERAAEGRDRAERAAAVAAAGQLERRQRAGLEPRRGGTTLGALAAARSTGLIGSSSRRSWGVCGWWVSPATIDAQPGRDVGVVVEAEHGVGLGQRLGELLAVALGQAADRHDGLAAGPVRLEVGGLEQRVDGVLLGCLDEAAGVDHHRVGLGGVGDEAEPVGGQPTGQLLGVDLVAGAPEGEQRDGERVSAVGGRRSVMVAPEYAGRGAAATAKARGASPRTPAARGNRGHSSGRRRPGPPCPVAPRGPASSPSTVTTRPPSVELMRTGGTTSSLGGLAEGEPLVEDDLPVAVAHDHLRAAGGGGEGHRHLGGALPPEPPCRPASR